MPIFFCCVFDFDFSFNVNGQFLVVLLTYSHECFDSLDLTPSLMALSVSHPHVRSFRQLTCCSIFTLGFISQTFWDSFFDFVSQLSCAALFGCTSLYRRFAPCTRPPLSPPDVRATASHLTFTFVRSLPRLSIHSFSRIHI